MVVLESGTYTMLAFCLDTKKRERGRAWLHQQSGESRIVSIDMLALYFLERGIIWLAAHIIRFTRTTRLHALVSSLDTIVLVKNPAMWLYVWPFLQNSSLRCPDMISGHSFNLQEQIMSQRFLAKENYKLTFSSNSVLTSVPYESGSH
jgi:hypothetical protein